MSLPPSRNPVIAVCGAGTCGPELYETARQVGREIARRGATLVCGGLGGVMEAAARGAYEEGGMTVGIVPGPSTADANPYIRVAVATEMGQARNAIIIRTADGVVAAGGAYGTLSEIALALKSGKPVVSLGSWEVSKDLVSATDPAGAVQTVLDLLSYI